MVKLVIYSLAAWRLAHLLVHETGPGNMFQDLRRHLGVETVNGVGNAECAAENPRFGMFCCVFCMSVWTSAVVQGSIHPVKVLAVSAGAILIDKFVNP